MTDNERAEVEALRSEVARMRDLLDRRPALNAGLVESYAAWTRLVYISDAVVAGMSGLHEEMEVH